MKIPENLQLFLNHNINNIFRVESVHKAIKLYLNSKKTQGDLLTTWLNIEGALLNQVSRIQTQDNSDHDRTPLSIDWNIFHSVFDIVTWYACWKFQAHYDSMQKPFKPCTGIFSRVTGLPYAHIYDEK